MKLATREERLKKSPEPVATLGRVESLIAKGVNLGMIEKQSGIAEHRIHYLLDAERRDLLGVGVWQPGGPDVNEDARTLLQLQSWLDAYDAENRRQRAIEYTEIETGMYLDGLAAEAMNKKRLFHVIGGYGLSKTKTMERFCAKHPMTHETPGAVLVTLTAEEKTSSQLYYRMSDAMRINEKFQIRGRSIGQRVRNGLRAGDVVVVDEANLLFSTGLWSVFKDVFDNTPASVMMLSNPTSNGLVRSNQEELGAFLSRCRTRTIDGNVSADGIAYAKALGYTDQSMIDEAGIIVTTRGLNGGMRAVAKAFEDGEQMAARKGVPLNLTILRQAAKTNSVFFK